MTRKEEITRESLKRYPNSPERNFGTGDYEYPEYHDDEREAFEAGAKWMQETMIDKACECLIKLHNWPTQYEEYARLQEEFIKEFRKAMEE